MTMDEIREFTGWVGLISSKMIRFFFGTSMVLLSFGSLFFILMSCS